MTFAPFSSSLRAKRGNPGLRVRRSGLPRRFAPRNDEAGLCLPALASVRPAWATARCATTSADRADIAEQILEEAALTAQRRGLVAIGVELDDLFLAGQPNRPDVARRIEIDLEDRLFGNPRAAERRLRGRDQAL